MVRGGLVTLNKWDQRFIDRALGLVSWSKDDKGVGCVLVRGRHEIMSGFNGIPMGCEDLPVRLLRPKKDYWMEHAERNAIFSAARLGIAVAGCTAYVTKHPCAGCARGLVQAGITRLVCPAPVSADSRWWISWAEAVEILAEACIEITYID
jgi:dCMP deaminase